MTFPRNLRYLFLVGLSLLGVFALQPKTDAIAMQVVLPLLSVLLVLTAWIIVRPAQAEITWETRSVFVFVNALGLALLGLKLPHFSRTVSLFVLGVGAAAGWLRLLDQTVERRKQLAVLWITCLVALLFCLKTVTAWGGNWQWIGISYLVLRLISVLIEFRADRLPSLSLEEMVIYTLLPFTLLAGPIDRAGRFTGDLRAAYWLDGDRLLKAGERIAAGLLKKFVLADSLALAALSPQMAAAIHGMPGAWFVVYMYAFQLYFDFSGYSDIAIGLAMLVGIDLPENFNYPYLRTNLAAFWQNWHISLTDWFRTHFFLPFSRGLLRRKLPIPDYLIAQAATLSLIGLWHGVSTNFLLWGLWHALGLFVHKLWVDHTRRFRRGHPPAWARYLLNFGGVFLTFHYVMIGWVFFALPEPAMSFEHLRRMIGL